VRIVQKGPLAAGLTEALPVPLSSSPSHIARSY
jgi:hypothetical protein